MKPFAALSLELAGVVSILDRDVLSPRDVVFHVKHFYLIFRAS
jgi:hypothetical protein